MRDRVGMEAEVVVAEAGRAWVAFWEAGLASSFSSAVALQSMRVYLMVGDSQLSSLSWVERPSYMLRPIQLMVVIEPSSILALVGSNTRFTTKERT